ncbi:hypothetical protein JW926_13110 [Candidatus Sumerlaeota bacterium]|nr:hypothetical protein [Candidatus Sumerlaeota bacterium]
MPEIDKNITVTFNKCEKCGYEKGFHIMLDPVKFTDRLAVKLVCPECMQVYHVGFTIKTEL